MQPISVTTRNSRDNPHLVGTFHGRFFLPIYTWFVLLLESIKLMCVGCVLGMLFVTLLLSILRIINVSVTCQGCDIASISVYDGSMKKAYTFCYIGL